MNDKQETIADIIAEARDKYTVHECNQCAWRKCCSEGFGSEKCGKFRESIFLKLGIEDGYFTQLLDRLEAAQKREAGDAAKLREAVIGLRDRISMFYNNEWIPYDEWEGANDDANSALAAPPRNCDRFKTAAEAAHRRERGDCAKLREALVKCREIALQWQADEAAGVAGTTDKPHSRSAAEAVVDMEFEINAALSTPPRNCDLPEVAKDPWRA